MILLLFFVGQGLPTNTKENNRSDGQNTGNPTNREKMILVDQSQRSNNVNAKNKQELV